MTGRELRVFGERNARALLDRAGMDSSHPHYAFFLEILTVVCEAATEQTRTFRSIGEQLRRLTAGESLTGERIAELRGLADVLVTVDLIPDLEAVRGIQLAVKAHVVELARQSGNRQRAEIDRNARIKARGKELKAGNMSERAAARKIRSEMRLRISADRVRQIAFPKKTG